MNAIGLLAARETELLALRRAAADEDRVEPAAVEEFLEALDAVAEPEIDAHVDDVADLIGDDRFRQAKRRDVRQHQSARLLERLEDRHFVAKGHQIVRNGEGSRACTDAGDALAVPDLGRARQAVGDVIAQVRSDALQAADGDRLRFDAAAAARGLARAIAHTSEYSREYVGFAIEHVRVAVPALGDQPDVGRHIGVSRTGPLAIYDAVKIIGVLGVRRFHICVPCIPRRLLRGGLSVVHRLIRLNLRGFGMGLD